MKTTEFGEMSTSSVCKAHVVQWGGATYGRLGGKRGAVDVGEPR